MSTAAFLYDRGGNKRIGQFTGLIQVRWDRRRDDVSECEITFRATGNDCCALVQEARSVRHELVIVRNGERVWEGPVTGITTQRDGHCLIRARDVLFFTQRTVVKRKWSSAFPRVEKTTERTARIMREEMKPWEEAGADILSGLVVSTTADTARTTRVSEAYSGYVWDDMDALAMRSGMDYVVVGRKTVLFDTHEFLGMGRPLVDEDFPDGINVNEYGVELAVTSYSVGTDGKVGTSSTPDTYYGPVELLAQAYDSGNPTATPPTVAELTEEAKRNQRSRYPAPVMLRIPESSALAVGSVDGLMPWLVPGTAFPVTTERTCRPMQAVMKLDKVVFEETPQGEKVLVTLSPAPVGSDVVPVDI